MSQAPSRTRIAAPGTTSGGRNEDSSRRNPQETFMNHPLRTADDTKMEIGARMRPGVPNGTGTAASHPPELVARFERDAMPFLSKLYTVATLLIRERAAAEDLVQETYLRALPNLVRSPGRRASRPGCSVSWPIPRSAPADSYSARRSRRLRRDNAAAGRRESNARRCLLPRCPQH